MPVCFLSPCLSAFLYLTTFFVFLGLVEPNLLLPRPLNGLLYQPKMLISVEQSVEFVAGETEVLGENLSQCRFVHYKSHMTWPGFEPGPLLLEPGD
jgi:hypothetical protein